jgi:hypothetical protein
MPRGARVRAAPRGVPPYGHLLCSAVNRRSPWPFPKTTPRSETAPTPTRTPRWGPRHSAHLWHDAPEWHVAKGQNPLQKPQGVRRHLAAVFEVRGRGELLGQSSPGGGEGNPVISDMFSSHHINTTSTHDCADRSPLWSSESPRLGGPAPRYADLHDLAQALTVHCRLPAGRTRAGRIWSRSGELCPAGSRSVMEPGEVRRSITQPCSNPGFTTRCGTKDRSGNHHVWVQGAIQP